MLSRFCSHGIPRTNVTRPEFSILMITPVPPNWTWLGKAVLENHAFVTIDLTIPCNWVDEYPPNCEACQWNDPAQCDKVRLMTAHVLIDNTDPEYPIEVGQFDLDDKAYGVYVVGDYAYIANSYDGLKIINITDRLIKAIGFYGKAAAG